MHVLEGLPLSPLFSPLLDQSFRRIICSNHAWCTWSYCVCVCVYFFLCFWVLVLPVDRTSLVVMVLFFSLRSRRLSATRSSSAAAT